MKKKWAVIQNLYKKSALQLYEYGLEVVAQMTGNAYFTLPNPEPSSPTLAETTASLVELNTAFALPKGSKVNTNTVNQAYEKVLNNLDLLGSYVQIRANQTANKTIGDVIINSAGMEYKKTGLPKQRVFEVINSPAQQGNVVARTVIELRGAYEWQYKKANEVNYQIAAITVKSSYTFVNLQSGTRYDFRVKTIDNKGNANLSQVLELVVL